MKIKFKIEFAATYSLFTRGSTLIVDIILLALKVQLKGKIINSKLQKKGGGGRGLGGGRKGLQCLDSRISFLLSKKSNIGGVKGLPCTVVLLSS